MEFVIPSKTFLIGEYLALQHGPALIAATAPSFKLSCREDTADNKQFDQFSTQVIHPQSPAGRLLKDHHHLFNNMTIRFDDPHNGQGGFGASGAQFLSIYQAIQKLDNKLFNRNHLAAMYHRYHNSGSGADIVTQLCGQITLFTGLAQQPEKFSWPFKNIGFMVVRTGFKINTHEHLQSSYHHLPFETMHTLVRQAIDALHVIDDEMFSQAIHNYGDLLHKYSLLYKPVKALIQSWQQQNGVIAVKGCGAMGADVILVLYKKNVFRMHDCDYVAYDTDLTDGIHEL